MSTPIDSPSRIVHRLTELREEHRDLDAMIQRLAIAPEYDELALKRMKKRKLRLKDMIVFLENQLIPDEPA